MPQYTITPSFLKYAKENISYIYDVLFVFIPDNSKRVCLDTNEQILNDYDPIIKESKDLSDWLSYLTLRKDFSIKYIDHDQGVSELALAICKESFDKLLVIDDENEYKEYRQFIRSENINIINKDIVKLHLNYSNQTATSLPKYEDVDDSTVFNLIKNICDEFTNLLEFNGINKLIFKDNKRVPEKNLQLIFYAIAFSFCQAHNVKISPESNSGVGPVDFNFSHGLKANVNVEIKFADNPKLKNGLKYQLPAYNDAERTKKSIYLIVYTKDSELPLIDQLEKELKNDLGSGLDVPCVITVDARLKKSASNRS